MSLCESYDTYTSYNGVVKGICNGTRERDLCSCEGDINNCTYYNKKYKEILKEDSVVIANLGEGCDHCKSICNFQDFLNTCKYGPEIGIVINGNKYGLTFVNRHDSFFSEEEITYCPWCGRHLPVLQEENCPTCDGSGWISLGETLEE